MKTATQYTPERPHGWMDDASCGSLPGYDRLPIARQQAICADCPVRGKCEEWMEPEPERPRVMVVARRHHTCPTGYHQRPANGCYTTHGCGCPGCRAEHAEASRRKRAARKSSNG